MARLYEEIDDYDETNYLTPVHNWSLMVGCIPQIHRDKLRPEEHDLCDTELEIFVTVLKCMRLKWPPANNILSTVTRLRSSGNRTVDDSQMASPLTMPYLFPTPIWKDLFPFSKNLCPRMALVDSDSTRDSSSLEVPMVPGVEGSMDWVFDEFNLDFMNMPFVG